MKKTVFWCFAAAASLMVLGCTAGQRDNDPMRAAMIAADLANRHPADRERVPDDGTPYRLTNEQKKAAQSAYIGAMGGIDPGI